MKTFAFYKWILLCCLLPAWGRAEAARPAAHEGAAAHDGGAAVALDGPAAHGGTAAAEVARFEAEAAAVAGFGAVKSGAKVDRTWNFVAEGRYNFPAVPVDAGVQFYLGAFSRDWASGLSHNHQFKIFSAVADWNPWRGRRVAPFVGCAAGVAAVKTDRDDFSGRSVGHDCSPSVMPRIGIEFFRRMRLTAGYRWMKREYRHAEVSLGVVVGGGKR